MHVPTSKARKAQTTLRRFCLAGGKDRKMQGLTSGLQAQYGQSRHE
jgi:hypothetical protein